MWQPYLKEILQRKLYKIDKDQVGTLQCKELSIAEVTSSQIYHLQNAFFIVQLLWSIEGKEDHLGK